MKQKFLQKAMAVALTLILMSGSIVFAQGEGEPAPTPNETPTLEPTLPPTAEPTLEPTLEPTAPPTAEPTLEPTLEPTAPPTAEPSLAPTLEPTAPPTAEPSLAPTAWDEATCNHANENCAEAPKCEVAGCEHIAKNKLGLSVPACALGAFLLDRQDGLIVGVQALARVAPLPLDLDIDDVPLYRSGNYAVINGEERENAAITVKENRTVSLSLDTVTVKELILEKNTTVIIESKNASVIGQLTISEGCKVTFIGNGVLDIKKASQSNKQVAVAVQSGGVKCAALSDTTGRVALSFSAQGAQALTVEGKNYNAMPLNDTFYLYLSAPAEGTVWTATKTGNTLHLAQKASAPSTGTVSGTDTLSAPGTYEIVGAAVITVSASDVTLLIKGGITGDISITGDPCAMVITGQNSAVLTSTAVLALSGTGSINAAAIGGTQGESASGLSLDMTLYVDGKQFPLLLTQSGLMLAPPANNHTYRVVEQDKVITVTSVPNDVYQLKDGNVVINTSGAYTLTGKTQTAAVNVTATAAKPLSLTFNDNCLVNRLEATNADIITASGRLYIETAPAAASYHGNIQIKGNPDEVIIVTVVDENGLPLADLPVTVRIGGGETLAATTFSDGTLHLRGYSPQSGKDIAVTDGETVYTTVIKDASGKVTPGFNIENVIITQTVAGTLEVAFTVPGGITNVGVSLKAGDQAPIDAFDPSAAIVTGTQSPITLTGLTAGQAVSLRVFASNAADAPLSAASQDGFAFSNPVTHTVKADYQPDASALNTSYTGEDYVLPIAIPEGITVAYKDGAVPKNAGDYTLVLTVPPNHPTYFAKTITCPFTISKAQGDSTLVITGPKDHAYNGKPLTVPTYETLTTGPVSVTYYVINESGTAKKLSAAPRDAGNYRLLFLVAGDANVIESTVTVDYTIRPKTITITPEPNLFKYEGEQDPLAFYFTHTDLVGEDEIFGELVRKEGEEAGNYPYLLTYLDAGGNYKLQLASGASAFLIMPSDIFDPENPTFPRAPFERINPIHQIIFLLDGRKLDVVLNTADNLTFSYMPLGSVMRESTTLKSRPLSPSMRLNEAEQAVLLMIRGEAELNKDRGYATDDDGHLLYTGRTLRLGNGALNIIKRKGVSYLGLQLKDFAITFAIDDLFSPDVSAMLKEKGMTLKDAVYYFTIEPAVNLTDAETQGLFAAAAVADAYRMRVEIGTDRQKWDLTPYLPSLLCHYSMESVARLMAEIDRYDDTTFALDYELVKIDGNAVLPIAASFIEPYMPSESAMFFTRIMGTHRYLAASTGEGLYTVRQTVSVK